MCHLCNPQMCQSLQSKLDSTLTQVINTISLLIIWFVHEKSCFVFHWKMGGLAHRLEWRAPFVWCWVKYNNTCLELNLCTFGFAFVFLLAPLFSLDKCWPKGHYKCVSTWALCACLCIRKYVSWNGTVLISVLTTEKQHKKKKNCKMHLRY